MDNRIVLFALAFAACVGRSKAQGPGEIQGRVVDEDGGPIPATSVSAVQGENRFLATTDDDGRFVLKPLPPGAYDVRVVAMNVDRTIAGVLVDADHATRLGDVAVTDSRTLPGVVIEKRRWEEPLIKMDDPGVVRLFHKQFEHNTAIKTPVAMIANYAPGVYKPLNGDGLFFRGARSENMCYIVDGVKLGSTLTGVPGSTINSFSVYTGGVPAKYGDVTGGVVAIETKSYFDLYQQRNAGIR